MSGRQVVVEYLGKDTSLGSTTGSLGGTLKKFGLVAAAGFGAVVAGGKGLYEVGQVFDDVSDTIRVKTGATGKDLESLTDSAKKVGTEVPASFRDVGTTLAELNQRMGLTGRPLEKLTKQFLEAGRITDEALNVKTFTSAFNAFDVQAGQSSKTMDELFRVSQSTGVGMNELASSVARNAPNLKQFGFSIGESASLIGTLDKAGLDSNKTLATLSRAMVQFAKDGKEPQQALRDTVDQITAFTKSGNDAAAINLAGQVFGTRGASQFVAAIKSGKVSLDDLTAATKGHGDTIMKASHDTADFAEQWQIFKNKALLTLEPIASRVFNSLGDGMAWLNQNAGPAINQISQGVQQFSTAVGPAIESTAAYFSEKLGPVFQAIGTWVRDTALPALQEFGAWLGEVMPPLIDRVKQELDNVFSSETAGQITETLGNIRDIIVAVVDAIQYVWQRWGDQIKSVASSAFNLVKAQIVGTLDVIQGIIKIFAGVLTGDWGKAWDGVKQIAEGVWIQLKAIVQNGANALKQILSIAWDLIKQGAGAAWDGIKKIPGLAIEAAVGILKGELGLIRGALEAAWDAAKAAARAAWSALVDAIRSQIGDAVGLVKALPGRVRSAIGDLGHLLWNAGSAIIQGLIDGIASKISALTDKLHQITSLIPLHKGPIDKDRILLQPAGAAIMEGLIRGIESKKTALADVLDAISGKIKDVGDKLRSLIDARNQFAAGFDSFTSSVFGQTFATSVPGATGTGHPIPGGFAGRGTDPASGVTAMILYQQEQERKAQQLAEDVKKLIGMGLSEDLIRQMQSQGESGIANIHLLAGGTADQIAALNEANAATQAALNDAGMAAGNDIYGDDIREERKNKRLAEAIAEEFRKLRDREDQNTKILIQLTGRTIEVSLAKLKRERGGKLAFES